MEIRAAKAHERDEIVDLISAVFVEKCRPRYASQHYQDSSYELDQSRVCVVDGKIVSYVRVSDRSMYVGKEVVKLGGIGMVVTSSWNSTTKRSLRHQGGRVDHLTSKKI